MTTKLMRTKLRPKSLAALCLWLLLLCSLAACKKAPPSADADDKLFLSAAPDIKAGWDGAVSAAQSNGAVAFSILRQLRLQPGVTPAQALAVDNRCKTIILQLAAASQKGDTNAAQELLEIRRASRGRRR